MNKYLYLISLIYLSSITTISINGYLMIKEKDTLNFLKLSKHQQMYTICLIYNELFIASLIIYNTLFYIYNCIVSCYSDNKSIISFNLWHILYIFTGFFTHFYCIFNLLIHNNYIDNNIQNINIIFTSNMSFIILSTIINYLFIKNKKNDYKSIV